MKDLLKPFKVQAKNLHAALKARGNEHSLAYAQELVATQYGYANWDTLAGVVHQQNVAASQPLRLSQLPAGVIPDEIIVERGTLRDSLNVVGWEETLIELADDRQALEQALKDNAQMYPDGMATVLICLEGDGFDLNITAEELSAGCHQRLGGQDYWHLPGKDWYLQFVYATSQLWGSEKEEASKLLPIPEVTRSLKGVRLLTLASREGRAWDLQVLVPPHLGFSEIADKVAKEIERLRELDRVHEEEAQFVEYTEQDLRRYVSTLGCQMVDAEKRIGPWD